MAGTISKITANTETFVGVVNRLQDRLQVLITGGSTIQHVIQVKPATWLIIFI